MLTCGDGLTPIADSACFAAPIGSKPAPLILYLHGLYQPDAMREELDRQARVAKHAVARGYAVLALYGRMGICDTRGDHLDWICWPSNEQVASRAQEVVASWKEPLARARLRVGNGRTYVLGFSNGAYFAGLLAVRDLFPADAYVVAQGGPVEPVHALGHRAPILLLSTDEEAPQVHAEMDRFGSELAADGWSFVQEERTGWHELNDQDVEAALDFFDIPSHNALH
jgi:dienelactone hydrolase